MLDAETGDVLWQREIIKADIGTTSPPDFLYWSPDGDYLLLDGPDEPYPGQPHLSPIWRLRADGTGELVPVVEQGFLLGVISQWGE